MNDAARGQPFAAFSLVDHVVGKGRNRGEQGRRDASASTDDPACPLPFVPVLFPDCQSCQNRQNWQNWQRWQGWQNRQNWRSSRRCEK